MPFTVTVTVALPAACVGAMKMICVADTLTTLAAGIAFPSTTTCVFPSLPKLMPSSATRNDWGERLRVVGEPRNSRTAVPLTHRPTIVNLIASTTTRSGPTICLDATRAATPPRSPSQMPGGKPSPCGVTPSTPHGMTPESRDDCSGAA